MHRLAGPLVFCLSAACLIMAPGTPASAQDRAPDPIDLWTAMTDPLGACRARSARLETALEDLAMRLRASPEPMPDGGGSGAESCAADARFMRERNIDLSVRLRDARAEIQRLEARLAEVGLAPKAGFGYVGGVVESFVDRDKIETLLEPEARLPADRCDEALAWLSGRSGEDGEQWLMQQVWVWSEDGPRLCAPTAAGDGVVRRPSASAEAHAVVYQ
jgi:hypothetical protein